MMFEGLRRRIRRREEPADDPAPLLTNSDRQPQAPVKCDATNAAVTSGAIASLHTIYQPQGIRVANPSFRPQHKYVVAEEDDHEVAAADDDDAKSDGEELLNWAEPEDEDLSTSFGLMSLKTGSGRRVSGCTCTAQARRIGMCPPCCAGSDSAWIVTHCPARHSTYITSSAMNLRCSRHDVVLWRLWDPCSAPCHLVSTAQSG